MPALPLVLLAHVNEHDLAGERTAICLVDINRRMTTAEQAHGVLLAARRRPGLVMGEDI